MVRDEGVLGHLRELDEAVGDWTWNYGAADTTIREPPPRGASAGPG